MPSVNKVILIGNLGADPESRVFSNGEAICNLRIATTEKWKDKNSGEAKEATEWHRVTLYRRLAEVAFQYLKRGSTVYIEGKLRTKKWQDKSGAERYTIEIEASEMKMLGKPTSDKSYLGRASQVGREPDPWKTHESTKITDWDDIPF